MVLTQRWARDQAKKVTQAVSRAAQERKRAPTSRPYDGAHVDPIPGYLIEKPRSLIALA